MEDIEEKPKQHTKKEETDGVPTSVKPRQQPSALFARGNRKAVKSPQRSLSKIKENKHPFALYGWGERQTDTGSQKTHNVCASAPVHEVRLVTILLSPWTVTGHHLGSTGLCWSCYGGPELGVCFISRRVLRAGCLENRGFGLGGSWCWQGLLTTHWRSSR